MSEKEEIGKLIDILYRLYYLLDKNKDIKALAKQDINLPKMTAEELVYLIQILTPLVEKKDEKRI